MVQGPALVFLFIIVPAACHSESARRGEAGGIYRIFLVSTGLAALLSNVKCIRHNQCYTTLKGLQVYNPGNTKRYDPKGVEDLRYSFL